MRVSTTGRTTADDVRRVALAALSTALDDGKQEVKAKPGLTGVRAVATGAVLYTAGRAAFAGRRFYRDHFGEAEAQEPDDERDEDEHYDDDPRAERDEDDEEFDDDPRDEDDEEFDDDEPRAESEEDEDEPEDDEEYDDEPRAEEDEEEEYEDEDDEGDRPSLDLPRRRRSRSAAGRN